MKKNYQKNFKNEKKKEKLNWEGLKKQQKLMKCFFSFILLESLNKGSKIFIKFIVNFVFHFVFKLLKLLYSFLQFFLL